MNRLELIEKFNLERKLDIYIGVVETAINENVLFDYERDVFKSLLKYLKNEKDTYQEIIYD